MSCLRRARNYRILPSLKGASNHEIASMKSRFQSTCVTQRHEQLTGRRVEETCDLIPRRASHTYNVRPGVLVATS